MAERPKIGIEIHPAHSRLRRGLQRIRGPVKAWLSNRWNLRGRRRGRVQRERLQAMVSPIASMPGPIDTATRSAADLFDRLPFSVMLQFGYGMGESVVVAATLAPDRIGPLVDAMRKFNDDELLGVSVGDEHRLRLAVTSRNELMGAVREVVRVHPKPGAATP